MVLASRSTCFVIVALAQLLWISCVYAAPWIEANDARLRRDIELLASFGVIDGPITMWPLPWAQVTRSISERADRAYPHHVEAALARVRAAVPKARDYRGLGLEANIGLTSREKLVRGADGGVREDADLSVSAEKHWGTSYAKLSVGWRDGQPGNNVHFDNSYFAKALGNWVVYGGTVAQWWGGGWDAGLLVSNNARPAPKLGLQRLDPKPFESKWLSWIGNWNLSLNISRLDEGETRTDFDHPLLAHIRLSLQPIERLDISFSRAIQICGAGRPCGFDVWSRALIGLNDLDNTGTFDEPGNQLAGADLRYSGAIGDVSYGIYAEAIAEDQNQPIVDKYSVLFGATLGGYWESRELQWRLRAEASDTKAGNIFGVGRDSLRNITYTNFIYSDGYEFLNRTIGHSLGGDSQLYTLENTFIDRNAGHYWFRYRRARINLNSVPSNEVSRIRETVNLIEAGTSQLIGDSEVRIEARFMDDQPNSFDRNDFDAQIELSWRFRF